MLMNNNEIAPHLHYGRLAASVLIHGPGLRLIILCSLFSPPSHPLRMLLSLPEADPVDRIDRAPAGYWLTSVSVRTTRGTSRRREREQGLESGQRGETRVHSPCWPCGSSSCGAPSLQGSGWQWLISSGLSQGASNLISFLPSSHL